MVLIRRPESQGEVATAAQAHPRWSGHFSLPLVMIIVGAFLLRFAFLGAKSLDLDEATSIYYGQLSWRAFWDALSRDANMSLYYGLVRLWRYLGESEVAIRSLSLIPAVATVPVVYAFGTRLFGRRVGVIAAALLSVNAFHIQYAQEARSYSLVALLVTLSSLFFIEAVETPSRQHWGKYVLVSVFAVYAHLFATFVLVGQWFSLALPRPRLASINGFLISVAVIGMLCLPLGLFIVLRNAGQTAWIHAPTRNAVIEFFYALTAGSPAKPLLAAYVIACLIAVVGAGKTLQPRKPSWTTWHYGLLSTWFWAPILLTLGISMVKPIFMPYYLIICLPPLVLLGGAGFARIRPMWLMGGTLALVLGLALAGDYRYYTDSTLKNDFRDATNYVLTHAQRGDAILFFVAFAKVPFNYYRNQYPAPPPYPVVLPDSAWKDLRPGYARVWVFLNHNDRDLVITQEIETSLAGRYSGMIEHDFTGVRVTLYSEPKAQ